MMQMGSNDADENAKIFASARLYSIEYTQVPVVQPVFNSVYLYIETRLTYDRGMLLWSWLVLEFFVTGRAETMDMGNK